MHSGNTNYPNNQPTSSDTKNNLPNISSIICRRCGGKGHYATQCATNSQSKPSVKHLREVEDNEYISDQEEEEFSGKDQAE